ncbi:GntR family transcriptional regulator [Cohnella silvisoli]|uniref:GntR family transcriptional regulator n=1 Tax=Cohnella silvisoli TaxID=2873699 RepID=A0ABV1KXG9_9BACL|nr:GntR family transcriptional regulator [Cohnella silvisoli]MCD9024198.1 GntR family transcriptional regulator [Cohnella silvisoli]
MMREKLKKGPVVLYEQMRVKIMELIRERGLKPHDPVPSETELAKMYGVSSRTSKEALLQLAREGIVYRMPRRGTFLAKLPDDGGTGGQTRLRIKERQAVGVLLPDTDEYVGRVLQALTVELIDRGFEVLVRFTSGLLEKEDELARDLVDEYSVAGLIIYPGRHDTLSDLLIQLHTKQFPVVIVDRAFREISIPSVYHDHLHGASELTAYLISNGHRRIGFVSEEFRGVMSREDRFNGYTQAFLDASLSLDLSLVYKMGSQRSLTREAEVQLDRFIAGNRDMTAAVCSNDYVALSVMQSAYRLGITVPEQLSVVGFTDFTFAELLPVPLTTVEKTAPELGTAAAKMLSELIADPTARHSPLVIPTRLKERKSVKSLNINI